MAVIRSAPVWRIAPVALLSLLCGLAPGAHALPQGGVVQAGTVTISTPHANAMVLQQATSKAVVDWHSFSIGAGQTVQFLQPSAASVALNRVVGGDVSAIFGTLAANGQVFLVNPAGVLFAPGARIDVGGLVATTLNVSNADFLAGRYTFSGASAASVANHGYLRGGYVALAGAQVTNTGTVEARPGGTVALLAGSRVTLDPGGDGLVRFSVEANAVNASVSAGGTMIAEGGHVAVSAGVLPDVLPSAVNLSGVVRAGSATLANGVVTLAATGPIDWQTFATSGAQPVDFVQPVPGAPASGLTPVLPVQSGTLVVSGTGNLTLVTSSPPVVTQPVPMFSTGMSPAARRTLSRARLQQWRAMRSQASNSEAIPSTSRLALTRARALQRHSP